MTRIGVSGHRELGDSGGLLQPLGIALKRIEAVFHGRPLTILSLLAEGTDQLVARVLLEEHAARLVAVLPMPESDYLQDFKSSSSRDAFLTLLGRAERTIAMAPLPSREEAYEAAGRYVVDHCDVLIALWDGMPSRGRGGTAEIVAYARERQRPLAWIHASRTDPESGPAGSRDDAHRIRYERLPASPPIRSG